MRNAVDVRQLMSMLISRGYRHMGLSPMLGSLHGQVLDKRLQCSSWDERPLTREQVLYAGNDASCLIDIFVVAAEVYSGRTVAERPVGSPSDKTSDVYSLLRVDRLVDFKGIKESVFLEFGQEWVYSSNKWRIQRDNQSDFWRASAHHKGKKRSKKRVSGGTKSSKEGPFCGKLSSLMVPWGTDSSSAKFVCDEMLGGLAKELRLFGVDTELVPTRPGQERFHTHRFLISIADEQSRIVLTKDTSLMRRRLSDCVYHVMSDGKSRQAEEILMTFQVDGTVRERLMTRCVHCNGGLRLLEKVEEDDMLSSVPEGVRKSVDKFWVCSKNVEHIYWRGGLYERSLDRLVARLDGMKLS
jgi:uncharacterized protein with PIN domain